MSLCHLNDKFMCECRTIWSRRVHAKYNNFIRYEIRTDPAAKKKRTYKIRAVIKQDKLHFLEYF